MAIWCLSKTIACGTTMAAAALIYCIAILHNRKDKKEMDKADNNKTFEIKITNTSLPNVHNERHSFGKNSTNQSNMPVLSKVRQVVSPLSKQSMSNNPIKPPRSKRLYQIQSKAVEYYNSIMQNSARFFTHDESSETIILNNSTLSFEYEFGNQDNLNRSLAIHINNSVDSTNNKIQIKVFKKSIKLLTLNIKTLYTSDDPSTNNSLVMISQKNEPKEIDITIPSFNRRRVVERIMPLHGDRLTNAHKNKCTKEIERNNITVIVNASM